LALLSLKQLVSDAAGFGCSFAPRDTPLFPEYAEAISRCGVLPGASSFDHEARQLKTGIVKWFNATKGYGFIQPESGEADAFVHISAVERAGLRGLNEGQRVKYELVRGRNGKSSAENLTLVAA
jgi:CspA family cold shock protein